jgi:hypothetical protein
VCVYVCVCSCVCVGKRVPLASWIRLPTVVSCDLLEMHSASVFVGHIIKLTHHRACLALFAQLTRRFQASGEAWGASVSLLESESLEVQAFAASVLLQKCRNEGASIAPQARDEIGAAVLARAEVNLDQSSLHSTPLPLAPLCGRCFCGFCSCSCSCCSNAFSSGGLPACIVAFRLWHFALVTARAHACLHRQQRRA